MRVDGIEYKGFGMCFKQQKVNFCCIRIKMMRVGLDKFVGGREEQEFLSGYILQFEFFL